MTSNFGSPDYEIKENSNLPPISETVKAADGSALDLTSASSVKFLLERPDGSLAVNAAASITDAAGGDVEYQLSTDETAGVGRHLGEFRVQYGNGDVRRWPSGNQYVAIDIGRNLGDKDAATIDDEDVTVTTITAQEANLGKLTSNLDANGQDITNVGSISTNDVVVGGNDILNSGDWFRVGASSLEAADAASTSSSYAGTQGQSIGAVHVNDIPSGTKLYGRLVALITNDTAGETTFTQPRLQDQSNFIPVPEAEVSATGTGFTPVDSGFVEITTDVSSLTIARASPQVRASGGTGTVIGGAWTFELVGYLE